MAAFSFNDAYAGSPPWDIGRPQGEFVNIARLGEVRGDVLDVGCGTGENAIYFSSLGLKVWGLDGAPRAIERAKRKAAERRAEVEFLVGDALHLAMLKRRFDTITDCGLFHVFSDEDRAEYARSLRAALRESGTYFMLCFSDKEPAGWGGPRRVSEPEIRQTFGSGWQVNYIREARFFTSNNEEGGKAWLSSVSATG